MTVTLDFDVDVSRMEAVELVKEMIVGTREGDVVMSDIVLKVGATIEADFPNCNHGRRSDDR